MEITVKDKITYQIISEIYQAVELLGGESDLLGTIGSWGDTMSDEDTLSGLRAWRKGMEADILKQNLKMAQQSLCPDTYEKFVDTYNELIKTRKLRLEPLPECNRAKEAQCPE